MPRPVKHTSNMTSHLTKAERAQHEKMEQMATDTDLYKTLSKQPPKYLDERAKKEYKRVVGLLYNLKITALDRQVLINYCNSVSMFEQAVESVKKDGLIIGSRKNPAVQIMLDMQKEIRLNASALGMTLDSRMKIIKPEVEQQANEVETDPYALLGA